MPGPFEHDGIAGDGRVELPQAHGRGTAGRTGADDHHVVTAGTGHANRS
jgi:hypothetical protein